MGKTASSTWKQFESRAAAFFGCRRAVLSGNTSGRDDREGGDTTHPRLMIECKLRAKHSVYRLWDAAYRAAVGVRGQSARVPVICLQEKHRPGFLICVHSDEFPEVIVEWIVAQPDDVVLAIEAAVARRRCPDGPRINGGVA